MIQRIVQGLKDRGYDLHEATEAEIKPIEDILRFQPGKVYICGKQRLIISDLLVASFMHGKNALENAIDFYEEALK